MSGIKGSENTLVQDKGISATSSKWQGRNLAAVSIRQPETVDGSAIHALVIRSATLDVNSEYAYLLLGLHFKQTCAVAEIDGRLAGFVSAYQLPQQQNVLFIWQVAVDAAYRGCGLAKAMLLDILQRPHAQAIEYLHTTVAPTNASSRCLFASLAEHLHTKLEEQILLQPQHFRETHEAEPLLVIGPLPNNSTKESA